MHVPSRPLMRSLLSQFQTPTAPRRVSRFFRVWSPTGLPRFADHSAYFGLATFYFRQPFQPSTGANLNTYLTIVNARNWCNARLFPTNSTGCNLLLRLRLLTRYQIHPLFPQHLPQCTRKREVIASEPTKHLDAGEIFKHGVERWKTAARWNSLPM